MTRFIADPRAAEGLARAIAADIITFNEGRLCEGLRDGTPCASLGEELHEGRALYLSRVSPALARAVRFERIWLQELQRWAADREEPRVIDWPADLVAALGEPPSLSSDELGGAPEGPEVAPLIDQTLPSNAAVEPVEKPPESTSVGMPAQWGIHEGTLSLLSDRLQFERLTYTGLTETVEIPLADVREVSFSRGEDSIDITLHVGADREELQLTSIDLAIELATQLLTAFMHRSQV